MTAAQAPAPAPAPMVPANPKQAAVQALFNSMRGGLAKVLPKHITPDRILKVAVLACVKQPKLLDCTRESLIQAMLQAAEVGLEPGSALQHAYFIPYRNKKEDAHGREYWADEVQFQIGWRGLLALARRSGEITRATAKLVYAKDHFEYEEGLEPKLVHRPYLDGPDRGEFRLAYFVAHLKDGEPQIEVMTRSEVDKVKDFAKKKLGKGFPYSPWSQWEEEMIRKTVAKRGLKWCPQSIELARAIEVDNAVEVGEAVPDFSAMNVLQIAEHAGPQETVPDMTTADKAKEALKVAAARPAPAPQQAAAPPPDGVIRFADDGDDEGIPK